MNGFYVDDSSILGEECSLYGGAKVKNSRIGSHCVVGEFSRLDGVEFGDFVRIDRNNYIARSGFGDCTYTGQFTMVFNSDVGKYCSISWGVSIGPGEHDYTKLSSHDFLYNEFYGMKPSGQKSYDRYSRPVAIGNDVWIGTNVTVLRGVTIGNGAVVGANSVVTKDVPDYAVVVGAPARVVKYRFTQEIIERLVALKWWDFPRSLIKENYKCFSELQIDQAVRLMEEIKENVR